MISIDLLWLFCISPFLLCSYMLLWVELRCLVKECCVCMTTSVKTSGWASLLSSESFPIVFIITGCKLSKTKFINRRNWVWSDTIALNNVRLEYMSVLSSSRSSNSCWDFVTHILFSGKPVLTNTVPGKTFLSYNSDMQW